MCSGQRAAPRLSRTVRELLNRCSGGRPVAAMHKAVLLLDAFPVRQVDFSAAVLNDGARGLDQLHRVLPVATFAGACVERAQ